MAIPMRFFIIRWRAVGGRIADARYSAPSAKAALFEFKQGISKIPAHIRTRIDVLGVFDATWIDPDELPSGVCMYVVE